MKVLIVGAGFAGTTFARILADNTNCEILVIDQRDHIGGNCYTYEDKQTGITMHKYGPHIFHTADKETWDFINRFTKFNNYRHKVYANAFNKIFSLPINLHTINQFYNSTFSPKEAEEFIKKVALEDRKKQNIIEPSNFEEQAIYLLGSALYSVFFKFYTRKQWGRDPKNLSASILKRLPVRFTYENFYYKDDEYTGIPIEGYTKIFENMLDDPKIKVELNSNFNVYNKDDFDYIIYTGPIDEFFDYKLGRLEYRTLFFKNEYYDWDYQGTSVMNYTDLDYNFTRITEHKYFTPEKNFNQTVITKEFPEEDNGKFPIYPINDEKNNQIYVKYEKLKNEIKNVIFVGRLANYRYYDMDQVIISSMKKAKEFIKGIS
jgi:UDP-galactopyranose mutase